MPTAAYERGSRGKVRGTTRHRRIAARKAVAVILRAWVTDRNDEGLLSHQYSQEHRIVGLVVGDGRFLLTSR